METTHTPEGWMLITLPQLGEVNRGRSRHRPRYAEHLYGGRYPFVQTGDVKASDGRISTFTQTYSEAGLAQSRLWPAGTMCVTIAANIAETGILEFPACFPDSVVGFIPDPTKADVRFVQYAFRMLKARLQHEASGSVQDNINLETLRRAYFPVPSFEEQRVIADVLGSLDDKIAANTKLLATIDALAQAQFRATLRDAHLQPLSDCAEFINGKAFTKGASGTGRVVVRIAELNSGIGGSTVFSDAVVENKHVASPGEILFAWSGSLTLRRWFRNDAIVNQHIFKVIPRDGYPDWLVYELLRNKIEDFKLIAADKATTMGHIQRKHLDEPVLVPSKPLRQEISPIMETLWRAAFNAEREKLTLATMRDTLLPQLMSGSLKVRDSETMVASMV